MQGLGPINSDGCGGHLAGWTVGEGGSIGPFPWICQALRWCILKSEFVPGQWVSSFEYA